MKKRSVHRDVLLPAHHQATKISQLGTRPLHFPLALIASQLPSVLHGWFCAVLARWTAQLDTPPGQALAQLVRVTRLVIEGPCGVFVGLRSPQGDTRVLGSKEAIFSHCSSVHSDMSLAISASL